MKENKLKNAMRFYLLATQLKYKIRSGWDEKHWNVSKERIESIAEHVYGTCILAISLDSEFECHIDLNKVSLFLCCLSLTQEKPERRYLHIIVINQRLTFRLKYIKIWDAIILQMTRTTMWCLRAPKFSRWLQMVQKQPLTFGMNGIKVFMLMMRYLLKCLIMQKRMIPRKATFFKVFISF